MNFTAYEQLETVLRHIDGAYAPNTLRAYRADMLEFIRHCEEGGATALPASPTTVANFLLHCTTQKIKTASLPQIMVKGGWAKTDTVMRYVERVRAL